MKKFALLLLVSFAFTACISPAGGTATRIKAKLIRTTCASIVIQIQDSNYYYLGEQWSDMFSPLTVMVDHAVGGKQYLRIPDGHYNCGRYLLFPDFRKS